MCVNWRFFDSCLLMVILKNVENVKTFLKNTYCSCLADQLFWRLLVPRQIQGSALSYELNIGWSVMISVMISDKYLIDLITPLQQDYNLACMKSCQEIWKNTQYYIGNSLSPTPTTLLYTYLQVAGQVQLIWLEINNALPETKLILYYIMTLDLSPVLPLMLTLSM